MGTLANSEDIDVIRVRTVCLDKIERTKCNIFKKKEFTCYPLEK